MSNVTNTVHSESSKSEVYKAWADLHKRLRHLLILYLSTIPGIALLSRLLSLGIAPDVAMPIAAGAWASFLITCSISLNQFHCPGCSQAFFRNVIFSNPWTARCCHCGLAVNEIPASTLRPIR